MTEMNQPAVRNYQTGFNQAYLLAEHEPELLNKLMPSIQPTNEYFEGFLSGKEQYEMDKTKSLNKERNNTPSKDHDLDMEKDY